MKLFLQKAVPHIVAITIFFLLSITFFYPVILENKEFRQMDMKSSMTMGQDAREYHEKTGDYSHWSNSMFGGMPVNYTYAPPVTNVFAYIGKTLTLGNNIKSFGLLFLYMFGFYVFLLSMRCSPHLAIIGAIAYAFCSYNLVVIEAGHILKGLVMATMAPIVGGIIMCYRGKLLPGAIITLIFLGLNIMWSHQQISYYLLLVIIIIFAVYLVYAIKEKSFAYFAKSSVVLLFVAIFAIAPSAGKLLPTVDYTKETMRGGSVLKNNTEGEKKTSGLNIDYAFQWSYGKMETFTLLIPNFYGGASAYNVGNQSETYKSLLASGQAKQFSENAPMYWGTTPFKTFTSGPFYAGAIVCFLFVLGLFVVKGREKWWLLTATILSLILAWGRNLYGINEFLFYYLPLYNKFRTPETALVIANLTMATLAILALKEILSGKNNQQDKSIYLKPIYTSAAITGGLCLLFAVLGGSLFNFSAMSDSNYPDWLQQALISDRIGMLKGDAWRSLGFIGVSVLVIFLYVRKNIKLQYVILCLGLLMLVDLWSVSKRFLGEDKFVSKQVARDFIPSEADKLIMQDTTYYRVLNRASSTFNESNTSAFHLSVGGYSPAKLRRYQDIIDFYFSKQINPNIVNMLNTKYEIVPTKQGLVVNQNSQALGNAWFVDTIKWVNSPDEEIVEVGKIDPANTVVIDKYWQKDVSANSVIDRADSSAYIKLINHTNPGYLVYNSNAPTEQFAVFSEIYYKTWKAYIDGKPVPLLRVNYILRGLQIPAGSHKIEFVCKDELMIKSAKVSTISSIIVGLTIVALLGLLFLQNRRREESGKKQKNSQQ